MSQENTKSILINVKDLIFKGEQMVLDLNRYLAESLSQVEISRNGDELQIVAPIQLSKRAIRFRIRKFFHKKALKEEYKIISSKTGYVVKEIRKAPLTYY